MKAFVRFTLGFLTVFLLFATGLVVIREGLLKTKEIEFVLDDSAKGEEMLFNKIQEGLRPQLKGFENTWGWNAPLSDVLRVVDRDSRIRTAHVLRRFPNRIVVVIRPKETSANLLDKDGYLHPIATDGSLLPPFLPTMASDRPTLRGAKFFDSDLLRQKAVRLIDELPEQGLFSKSAVSEVHYSDKTGFEFTLSGGGLVVRVGDESLVHKADHIEQVLSYLQGQHIKGRVIDARFEKKVVVKLRKQP
jgi:cell division protein FtsQ